MKVVKREEVWIHTHFLTDASSLPLKERRRIQWEMEGFLRGLGIVYGIHFKEGERLTVVLECIPEKDKIERIEGRLRKLLEGVKPKPKVTKIRVEGQEGAGGDKSPGTGDR